MQLAMTDDASLSCTEHLEAIQALAKEKWGTEITGYHRPAWEGKLIRSYVDVVRQKGDTEATPARRRNHLLRAFERGGCNADTLLNLYEAVGCRVQIIREQRVV